MAQRYEWNARSGTERVNIRAHSRTRDGRTHNVKAHHRTMQFKGRDFLGMRVGE